MPSEPRWTADCGNPVNPNCECVKCLKGTRDEYAEQIVDIALERDRFKAALDHIANRIEDEMDGREFEDTFIAAQHIARAALQRSGGRLTQAKKR